MLALIVGPTPVGERNVIPTHGCKYITFESYQLTECGVSGLPGNLFSTLESFSETGVSILPCSFMCFLRELG